MQGTFLKESSPHPSKNLNQWFVGEDIILPKTIPLRKKTGRTGDTGNFLERKVSRTLQRTLLKGYRSNALSRGILPTAKLWCLFEKAPQKSASSLLSDLFKNPPEIHLCEAKFCPRQEVKALDIKAKFADRTSAPLNRCAPARQQFARTLNL